MTLTAVVELTMSILQIPPRARESLDGCSYLWDSQWASRVFGTLLLFFDCLLYSCAGLERNANVVLRSEVQLINEFQTRFEADRMDAHRIV